MTVRELLNNYPTSCRLHNALLEYVKPDADIRLLTEKQILKMRNCGKTTVKEFFKLMKTIKET